MKRISLLLIIATLTGCLNKQHEKTGKEGKPVPSFKLLLTDSSTYFDTKDIPAGKPSVLFLYSPFCPYCRAQMDEIIEDIDMLKDIQFYLFTAWPFADMKKFYNHYKLNRYPNITVGRDYGNFLGNYFKAPGIPYMAIYGKDKKLKEVFIGKVYGRQIKKAALQ